LLVLAPEVWAKKAHPAATTSSTTQPAKGKSDEDVDTHKARAEEFSDGKPLDKAKTQSNIDKLTGQVNDLNAKVQAKEAEKEAQAPAGHHHHHAASTQPTTQQATTAPTGKSGKTKAKR
jgi:outer membrane murein-binding lipoprotein Lpp